MAARDFRRWFKAAMQDSRDGGPIYLGSADFADLDFIEALMTDHHVSFLRIDDASDDTSLFGVYEAAIPRLEARQRQPLYGAVPS